MPYHWTKRDTVHTLIPCAIGLAIGMSFQVWVDISHGKVPWEFRLTQYIFGGG